MGRVNLSVENKKNVTNYDYPKLKLKKGEHARILVGLEDPIVEYVHTVRKPKIENGRAVMKTEERRGRPVEVNEMDFVSRPICLGDPGVLEDKGSDPKNCPMCQMAKDHPDWMKAPEPRFAVHVIRYRTKSGGFEVTTPFAVDCVVWAFTSRTFNKLVDFATEHGDLRQRDLLLGPCENESFQKFDIAVGSKAEWLRDDDTKRLTAITFKENQIEDLSIAAGSKKEKRFIDMDLEDVTAAWADLGQATVQPKASLSAGLDDLMGSTVTKKEEAQAEWAEPAGVGADEDLSDILGTPASTPAPATETTDSLDDLLGSVSTPAPASTPEPAETTTASSEGTLNFDDILGDLSK